MEIKDIISSGLLELYVTGVASKEEALQVEQWAEQYPEVKKEIEDLQHVMETYALAEAIHPDAALKEKILSRIEPDGSVKEKIFSRISSAQEPFSVIRNEEEISGAKIYSLPNYFKWAVAASIVLLVGSAVANYILYNKYQSTNKNFTAINKQYDSVFNMHKADSNALVEAQQKLRQQKNNFNKDENRQDKENKELAIKDEKQNTNTDVNSYVNVAGDKYSVPVVLKGTKHAPDALAKIFWMKNTGDVYVDATYLPTAPQGKQYQLWAIVDGNPVDAGMITTQKGTYKIQKMKSFGSADAFAITLEKTGGSQTPTMDQMVVKAKI